MFDEENESSIEAMQAASIGGFLIIGLLAIIGLMIVVWWMK